MDTQAPPPGIPAVRHIVVGVDGSESARSAAYFACNLARQTGAHLTLVVAVEPPNAAAFPPFDGMLLTASHPDAAHLSAVEALMKELQVDLPEQVSSSVVVGPPVDTLLAEGARLGADLLVVGARGMGAAARLLLGSVSERLVRQSDRPVLVVR